MTYAEWISNQNQRVAGTNTTRPFLGTNTVQPTNGQIYRRIVWNTNADGLVTNIVVTNALVTNASPPGERMGKVSAPQRVLQTDTNFDAAQMIGVGVSMEQILFMAYGIEGAERPVLSGVRVLSPGDMPVGRFDFIANLPTGSRTALAKPVKEKFGLVGARTNIAVPCYILKQDHTGAPGLLPVSPTADPNAHPGHVLWQNVSLDQFVRNQQMQVEGYIANETGLTGNFNIAWIRLDRLPPRKPHETITELVQRDFLEQLGLKLILTNYVSMEFFQIAHVKQASALLSSQIVARREDFLPPPVKAKRGKHRETGLMKSSYSRQRLIA